MFFGMKYMKFKTFSINFLFLKKNDKNELYDKYNYIINLRVTRIRLI